MNLNSFFNFNFKNLSGVEVMTVFHIAGNKIISRNLITDKFKITAFKNSTKLKKFFEKWCLGKNIIYHGDSIYYSPDILDFKRK